MILYSTLDYSTPQRHGPLQYRRPFPEELPNLCVAIETVWVKWENFPEAMLRPGTTLDGITSSYGPYYLLYEGEPTPLGSGICSYERWYMPRPPTFVQDTSYNFDLPGISSSLGDAYTVQTTATNLVYYKNFNDGSILSAPQMTALVQSMQRLARDPMTDLVSGFLRHEFWVVEVNEFQGDPFNGTTPDPVLVRSVQDVDVCPKFRIKDSTGKITTSLTPTTVPTQAQYATYINDGTPLVAEQSKRSYANILGKTCPSLVTRQTIFVPAQ
jgi:hypothetical protein